MKCDEGILHLEGAETLALLPRAVGVPSLEVPKAMGCSGQPEMGGGSQSMAGGGL